jgi:hypothetical protein
MAKSETSTIRVQAALVNSACQLASPHQNDFAISITFGACQVMVQLLSSKNATSPAVTHELALTTADENHSAIFQQSIITDDVP